MIRPLDSRPQIRYTVRGGGDDMVLLYALLLPVLVLVWIARDS